MAHAVVQIVFILAFCWICTSSPFGCQ